MAELPFFPIATDAYLADCDHLSDAEHGRYFQILIAMWRAPKQRLPNDDEWLARKFRRSVAAVVAELRPVISEFCKCDGNWITQKRLSKEFSYVTVKSKKQSARAKSRWNKDKPPSPGNATGGIDPAMPPHPHPHPHPHKEESRAEEGIEPCGSPPPAEKRATRLPDDWQVSDELRVWTIEAIRDAASTVSAGHELQKFLDYWRAKAGAQGRKLDWDATWRNWIRRAIEDDTKGKTNGTKRPQGERIGALARQAARVAVYAHFGSQGSGQLPGQPGPDAVETADILDPPGEDDRGDDSHRIATDPRRTQSGGG